MELSELNNFKRSLEFTLKWEGGYSYDPKDPGGETKWGISKRAYPNLDIKGLTPEDAARIYEEDYWRKSGANELEFPLCCAVFDTAVNCGVTRAKAFLSESKDPLEYCNRRIQYYLDLVKKNPSRKRFLRGWLNRVNDLKKLILISLAPE